MTKQMKCRECGAPLLPGPRGGASQNFYCTNRDICRAGTNITSWLGFHVREESIGEVADSTFEMYAKGNRQWQN